MSDTKIEPKFTFNGFGFPVELENVEMTLLDGEWHPKIDILSVCEDTMNKLVAKREKLGYYETEFVGSYIMYLVNKVLNDKERTILWLNTPNVLLDNMIPRHLIKAGEHKRLFDFIIMGTVLTNTGVNEQSTAQLHSTPGTEDSRKAKL